MPTSPPVISFFVACYNEEENIAATLDTLLRAIRQAKIFAEIIVVDDASSDGSVKIIQEWRNAHPEVPTKLHVNKRNQGLAVNFVEGAFLGSGEYYRLVCGDNVEPQETFEQVIASIGRADLVLFYQPSVPGRAWYRKLLSRLYTALINLLSGYNIRYYNGLPLIKRDLVLRWHSNSHGFGFQADLITRLLDKELSYIQLPVKAIERAKGQSKALTTRNLFSVAHTLLNIAIRRAAKIVYGYN